MIGTATQVEVALSKALRLNPSVIVIDQALPEGLAFSRALGELEPDVTVVALGVPESEESILAFAEAGIAGYPARRLVQDLVEAVQRAARGELQCWPQMAGAIVAAWLGGLRAGTTRL